jgi:hypothetical protein
VYLNYCAGKYDLGISFSPLLVTGFDVFIDVVLMKNRTKYYFLLSHQFYTGSFFMSR